MPVVAALFTATYDGSKTICVSGHALLFTDLVNITLVVDRLGDERDASLFAEHDRRSRDALETANITAAANVGLDSALRKDIEKLRDAIGTGIAIAGAGRASLSCVCAGRLLARRDERPRLLDVYRLQILLPPALMHASTLSAKKRVAPH